MARKIWYSIHPRNFGNHMTLQTPRQAWPLVLAEFLHHFKHVLFLTGLLPT